MLTTIAALTHALRTLLLAGGVLFTLVAALDWAARTRRISPFNGISRFLRARVDPHLSGIERLVLRTGSPASATPWWAVATYIIVALLLLACVDLVLSLVSDAAIAVTAGPLGWLWLLLHWAFGFLVVALVVRVVVSWVPALASSRWTSWSYGATEWMLRPLRSALPNFGPVDISPIVAYFGLAFLQFLLEKVFLSMVR